MRVSWFSHIAVRYAAAMVAVTMLPLAVVLFAYDRYASSLLDVLSGSDAGQRLAGAQGRLASFIEGRFAQLDTLATYPDLPMALTLEKGSPPPGVRAVLEYEADNPDLYGILIFDAQGKLMHAIPSQAATGEPYWGGSWEPLMGDAPRTKMLRGEVIGPFLPDDGRPGAFLMMRNLPAFLGEESAGEISIALHVRLSSLTELLGRDDTGGIVQPVLLTPQNVALTAVGRPVSGSAHIARKQEILPGWSVALTDDSANLVQPLGKIRETLIGAALLVIISIAGLVALLGGKLNRRIGRLVDGSAALAEGQLGTRIVDEGNDELAALASAFNRMAVRQRDTLSAAVEVEKMAVLGRFATSFAHEVRNPLAAVKTAVQALLTTDEKPDRRRLLHGMDEEIDRLDESLRDFLAYARPAPPSPRRVVMEDVLRRCETLVAHQLQSCNIALIILGETGLAIHVDPFHLQQILMNLVANAIDAMPEGGRITLRVRRAGGQGIIEVSDTGEGIAPEMLDRIMEPFVTTRQEGSGLGLPISRQLAELNKGGFALASQPGHGTTATVTLPREDGASA
ncbi:MULTISPECIES: HAMP domain-containing sensor histidine kinase [Rhodomicrobium]|uniref:sensor histidine kinase n=1 Tax=Rhodomicrobium TaxID=1068 RepID=UPI000B4AEE28|nr:MULTISPECIES: HAMP domain-containing sensor histidine kinase [Rhodomicrobium]